MEDAAKGAEPSSAPPPLRTDQRAWGGLGDTKAAAPRFAKAADKRGRGRRRSSAHILQKQTDGSASLAECSGLEDSATQGPLNVA